MFMSMKWEEDSPPLVHTEKGKEALGAMSEAVKLLIDGMMSYEGDIPQEGAHEEDRNILACYIEDLRNFKSVVDQSLGKKD